MWGYSARAYCVFVYVLWVYVIWIVNSGMSHKFLVEPEERVRQLSKHAASLAEVDFGIPLSRYYRASKEVVRIAQYYEKENCLENAFVLYSKYIT